MEDIQDVHFVELEKSKYLKPIRMKYTQATRDISLIDLWKDLWKTTYVHLRLVDKKCGIWWRATAVLQLSSSGRTLRSKIFIVLYFLTCLQKRFVFVRQFRPAIYMARAEEAGTPVTIGTRWKISGSWKIPPWNIWFGNPNVKGYHGRARKVSLWSFVQESLTRN